MFKDWETLVEALQIRFGATTYDDPIEALTRMRQSTTVVAYKLEFEALSNRIRELLPSHKLSCFLSGLKDDIRLAVKMLNPSTLNAAFGLAKIQEEYLLANKKNSKNVQEQIRPSILGAPKLTAGNETKIKLPIKRLSPAQVKERWKKRMCYNYDDKWSLDHKCKGAKFFLLEWLDFGLEFNQGVQIIELNGELEAKAILQDSRVEEVEITLYALIGNPTLGTMRVKGRIEKEGLVILLDSGSTHNFIDVSLLSKLHVPIDTTQVLDVKVAVHF